MTEGCGARSAAVGRRLRGAASGGRPCRGRAGASGRLRHRSPGRAGERSAGLRRGLLVGAEEAGQTVRRATPVGRLGVPERQHERGVRQARDGRRVHARREGVERRVRVLLRRVGLRPPEAELRRILQHAEAPGAAERPPVADRGRRERRGAAGERLRRGPDEEDRLARQPPPAEVGGQLVRRRCAAVEPEVGDALQPRPECGVVRGHLREQRGELDHEDPGTPTPERRAPEDGPVGHQAEAGEELARGGAGTSGRCGGGRHAGQPIRDPRRPLARLGGRAGRRERVLSAGAPCPPPAISRPGEGASGRERLHGVRRSPCPARSPSSRDGSPGCP